MMNDNPVKSTYPDQGALDYLLIGANLEDNLHKILHVLAIIQLGCTPPIMETPIKETAIAGADLLLEYCQMLVEIELNRLTIK